MGDRRNVIVQEDGKNGVALYTHWHGTDLPNVVRAAMKRVPGRWGDKPYLTRAIFAEMIKGDVMGETGYGISTTEDICEASGRDMVVDVGRQAVRERRNGAWVPFNDFIKE